jgi:hypothetical protein
LSALLDVSLNSGPRHTKRRGRLAPDTVATVQTKERVMRFSRRGLTVIAAAVVLASAAAVSAQATDSITDVPFAFTVGATTLPRDTYRISRLPGHLDVFQISSERHSAIVISQPESPDRKGDDPRLVFHRYGDSYFLREIRLPGNVAMSLPPTRLERDAAEKLASNAAPEVVVIDTRQ